GSPYRAGRGRSRVPSRPACARGGRPRGPGLVELITREQTAGGAPMAALRGHEGAIAIHTWRRGPADSAHVAWILGTTWMPYQLPTFVTPAFPGYVSGHSPFSRAPAERPDRLP